MMEPLSREQVEEQCQNVVYASNGDEGTHAAMNQMQYTDAALRAELAAMTHERDEVRLRRQELVTWGVQLEGDVESLHQQLTAMTEERNDLDDTRMGLEAELTDMTKARDQWKGFATHRIPTHGPCCTCQRCGLDHDACRCDLDDVAAELETAQQEIARLKKMEHETWEKAATLVEWQAHGIWFDHVREAYARAATLLRERSTAGTTEGAGSVPPPIG